jgi:hypothetical protein
VFIAVCPSGCKKEKYPSGRDTYKSFGDGRFQIGRLPHDELVLADCETQDTIIMNLYKYKTKGNQVFATSKEGAFAVLNYETGVHTTYKDANSVPAEYKKIFSQLAP